MYLYLCIWMSDTWEQCFWGPRIITFSKIYHMLGLSDNLTQTVFVYLYICVFVYLWICIFVYLYLCICAFVFVYLWCCSYRWQCFIFSAFSISCEQIKMHPIAINPGTALNKIRPTNPLPAIVATYKWMIDVFSPLHILINVVSSWSGVLR